MIDRMLPQELHILWNYRENLSMENGLITKGARLLIPSTLRKKGIGTEYMMDIWVLKSVCSKQETLYSGQAFPVISVRL